ncbi:MAG: thioredoxin family protein [Pirellulaceae bacterium]|nr:thioredoxin family protein [Pirellulaceae bacterium]
MITILTDETFEKWIEANPNSVILGWMEHCSFCDQFKPIFQRVADDPAFSNGSFGSILIARSGSVFKRQYMKSNIGEKSGAPCTFLFRDGQYFARHHGLLSIEQLSQFIRDGKIEQEASVKTIQQLSITELKAYWLDQILAIERSQAVIRNVQTELNSRSQV